MSNWLEKLSGKIPAILDNIRYYGFRVGHVHVSSYYDCDELAIWICDRMIYPLKGEAPPVNPDLPPDIRRVYDEASSILDRSPRGAAALI